MLSINRTENYEIAHNLWPYEGGCFNLHGHSYKVTVEITGEQVQPLGMIMDFKILKKVMNEVIPDHAFIYDRRIREQRDEGNILPELLPLLEKYGMRTVEYPCATTCENLVQLWADEINNKLFNLGFTEVYVNKLTANETQNSQAVYVSESNCNPYKHKMDNDYYMEMERKHNPDYKEGV